jgi:P4 family phage/plasmid primase-like protien
MNSYIYLIQDGEFIDTEIYKIGRTTQSGDTRSITRLKSYNKNTVQKYLRKVDTKHVIDIETDIKHIFKLKYKLIKGYEWFEGYYKSMIQDIDVIINKYSNLEDNKLKSEGKNNNDIDNIIVSELELDSEKNRNNIIKSKYMYISMNNTHSDIAKYIHDKYKYYFKCTSITNKKIYQYHNHKWNLIENGYSLKLKISQDISQDYEYYSLYCKQKSKDYPDEAVEKEPWDYRAYTSYNISIQLKNTIFRNIIFDECTQLLYDQKFEDELDSNDNLLHFLNGVYDLDKNEFREGKQEDNISLTTGINFIEQLNDDDYDKINYIEDLLSKIFPIEKVRDYTLNLLSSFLHGSNKEQKFYIWVGEGSNGKTMLINLFKKIMGSYCGSMPITLFTQKRNGNDTSLYLAETRGRRFISLDETETNDEIKIGIVKQLTGGDKIIARKLYSSPITFNPKFKLVLTCNELPSIPANDEGTWRRIRVIDFISKFCDNPNPNKKYEFIIDRNLQSKIDDYKEIFMYMLIQYYQNSYIKKGLQEPPEVLNNTSSYRSDNDIYSHFVNEFLCEDANSCLSIDDIFPIFRGFLQDNNINQSKNTRLELEKRLNKIIGKANSRKKWKGWKIAHDNDPEDE